MGEALFENSPEPNAHRVAALMWPGAQKTNFKVNWGMLLRLYVVLYAWTHGTSTTRELFVAPFSHAVYFASLDLSSGWLTILLQSDIATLEN